MRAKKRVDRSELNKPKYWKGRAEDARVKAKLAADTKARAVMLGFAEAYDRFAARVESPNASLRN